MRSYLSIALKVLGRRKVFTAISLFGITMTLGVMLVVTAILDNLVTPRGPENRFHRALTVSRIGQYGGDWTMTTDPGYAFLDRYVRTLPNIEKATIFTLLQGTAVYRDGGRIETMLKRTDGAYWQVLDFEFLEGRPFTAQDDEAGRHVAVINEDIREKLFDGKPAVGRTFHLDGSEFRVVGVVPRVPFLRFSAYSQIWVPIGTFKSADYRDKITGNFQGVVLLRDRGDILAVKREFQSRLARVPSSDPRQFKSVKAGLDTPFEAFARLMTGGRPDSASPARAVMILTVLALLFMALPALNLITLNLSRILERASEIGVRRAFGAPRWSLVRQFVFENIVTTVVGGIGGFILAAALLPVLNETAPVPDIHFSLNLRVFAWGMFFAVFFGVFSGVYPAWKMSRLHPVNALRGGSQ